MDGSSNGTAAPKGKGGGKGGARSPRSKGGRGGAAESKEVAEEDCTFKNLSLGSFTVQPGELLAVVGMVGSGKSSVLAAILGNMNSVQGDLAVGGSIAYCAQQPWIQNATVRDNIIFGSVYDEDRFRAVVASCALKQDLERLPGGEHCEVGERGITLSGGQKARISLARAVYSGADLFLLDDPLSAVDAHVGKHLFTKCIAGFIKSKTRVLVTNQLACLRECDRILMLENGQVAALGTFETLCATNESFAELTSLYGSEQYEADAEDSAAESKDDDQPMASPTLAGPGVPTTLEKVELDPVGQDKEKANAKEAECQGKKDGQLISKEDRAEGAVGWQVYMTYARAGGIKLSIFILCFFLVVDGLRGASEFFLAGWATESGDNEKSGQADDDTSGKAGLYAGLTCAGLLLTFARSFLYTILNMTASRSLHNALLLSLVHATTSFYDTTMLGRITNRFSRDVEKMDMPLRMVTQMFLMTCSEFLLAVVTIAIATKGVMLGLMLPLVYIYKRIHGYFTKSSIEMQRLESLTRTPIFNQFAETLEGFHTIRAYGRASECLSLMTQRIDSNTVCVMCLRNSFGWLGVRVDMLGAVLGFAVVVMCISFQDFLPTGWVGLSLLYATSVIHTLKMLTTAAAEMESNFNSVERIAEYTDPVVVPQEPDYIIEDCRPPAGWPSAGQLSFQDIALRYREGPMVLRNVSFTIQPGERVGVCGRTGAGKSSLLVALFRLEEICNGKILIDGQDICRFGVRDARQHLAIIPQDPVLFQGTVRYNLDPLEEHNDQDLYEALDHVRMREVVQGMPDGLAATIQEFGGNFSIGQRQLICMARALLRRPKILLMDEATASVDLETDMVIQNTLRNELGQCTVLTIAHRLNTIIDYDKILVMAAEELPNGERGPGTSAEYDAPADLLRNPNGLFRKLVEDSGMIVEDEIAKLEGRPCQPTLGAAAPGELEGGTAFI